MRLIDVSDGSMVAEGSPAPRSQSGPCQVVRLGDDCPTLVAVGKALTTVPLSASLPCALSRISSSTASSGCRIQLPISDAAELLAVLSVAEPLLPEDVAQLLNKSSLIARLESAMARTSQLTTAAERAKRASETPTASAEAALEAPSLHGKAWRELVVFKAPAEVLFPVAQYLLKDQTLAHRALRSVLIQCGGASVPYVSPSSGVGVPANKDTTNDVAPYSELWRYASFFRDTGSASASAMLAQARIPNVHARLRSLAAAGFYCGDDGTLHQLHSTGSSDLVNLSLDEGHLQALLGGSTVDSVSAAVTMSAVEYDRGLGGPGMQATASAPNLYEHPYAATIAAGAHAQVRLWFVQLVSTPNLKLAAKFALDEPATYTVDRHCQLPSGSFSLATATSVHVAVLQPDLQAANKRAAHKHGTRCAWPRALVLAPRAPLAPLPLPFSHHVLARAGHNSPPGASPMPSDAWASLRFIGTHHGSPSAKPSAAAAAGASSASAATATAVQSWWAEWATPGVLVLIVKGKLEGQTVSSTPREGTNSSKHLTLAAV